MKLTQAIAAAVLIFSSLFALVLDSQALQNISVIAAITLCVLLFLREKSLDRQLKKALQDAEAANTARAMFIMRISNELRNAIGGIVGINQLILKTQPTQLVYDLVKMSNLATEASLYTIDEIAIFSKAESGDLAFETTNFDLRQLVRDTMQVVAARLESKYRPQDADRVELVCSIDSKIPVEISGDANKIKQILINLLSNAIKFTSTGYVGLKISSTPSTLILEVWDTGVGIAAENIQSVFQAFNPNEAAANNLYQASGLGLTVAKQLAQGMRGSLSVSSKVGEGSRFTLALPLQANNSKTYGLLNEDPDERFPFGTAIVASASPVTTTLIEGLAAFKVIAQQIDPQESRQSQLLKAKISTVDLLVLSEQALLVPEIAEIVEHRVKTERRCTVAILSPSSLKLRQKLYQLGVSYILSNPVLADDLLLAFRGELDLTGAERQPIEDALRFEKKLKVLIADDLPTNLIILEDMLGEAGHQVTAVSNGAQLLERLGPMILDKPDAEQFDIVITDISMPIMDGDAATRAIRGLEQKTRCANRLPIIAVTGHAFKEDRDRILAAGVDAVIVKPVRQENIAQEIARLLSLTFPSATIAESDLPKATYVKIESEQDLAILVRTLFDQYLNNPQASSQLGFYSSDLLDIKELYRNANNSLWSVKLVLQAFHRSIEPRLAAICRARDQKNLTQFKKTSYSLMGMLLDIGCKTLARKAETIHTLSARQDLDQANTLVQELVDNTRALVPIVKVIADTLELSAPKPGHGAEQGLL